MTVLGASSGWTIGLVLGVVVVLVAAVIVITIVALAQRIAGQARAAVQGVEVVRSQTDALEGTGEGGERLGRRVQAAADLDQGEGEDRDDDDREQDAQDDEGRGAHREDPRPRTSFTTGEQWRVVMPAPPRSRRSARSCSRPG